MIESLPKPGHVLIGSCRGHEIIVAPSEIDQHYFVSHIYQLGDQLDIEGLNKPLNSELTKTIISNLDLDVTKIKWKSVRNLPTQQELEF